MKYTIVQSVVADDIYEVEADSAAEAFQKWKENKATYLQSVYVDDVPMMPIMIEDSAGNAENFDINGDPL